MCVYTYTKHTQNTHTHTLPMNRRKEGNILFNDTLNTYYLQLYGVRHMVKDHADSERRNPLPTHGLLLLISSCGALAGMRNSSMGPPWRIDPTTHRTMSERSYHGATFCSLNGCNHMYN